MRGHGWPLAAVVLAALLIAPAAARAVPVTAVALFNDLPAGVQGIPPQVFLPSRTMPIAAHSGSPEVAGVEIGPGGDRDVSVTFVAPTGRPLAPGTYGNALYKGDLVQGPRPGITFWPHYDCFSDEFAGQFEIMDFSRATDGTVQRMWAVFEVRCLGEPRAVYGEVRVNEPTPAGDGLVALPGLIRWPAIPAGGTTQDLPVTVYAARPVARLGRAVLAGRDATAFAVTRDGCAGQTLATGASCQVWVHAKPRTPGTRSAAVEVAGGPEVGLEAYGYGGRTSIVIDSDPGDPSGQGRHVTLDPGSAQFQIDGFRDSVGVRAIPSTGATWTATFSVPGQLAPGRYESTNEGPQMYVYATDSACKSPHVDGSFEITEATFDGDGFVRSLGARFEQQCPGSAGILRGTVEYRAADATPPAPWMGTGPPAPFPDTSAAACGGATHLVRGGRRADRLVGTSGRDRILGGAGPDRLIGRAGDDCLIGGPGRDVLDCGRGEDIAFVGRGDRVKGCERVVRRS